MTLQAKRSIKSTSFGFSLEHHFEVVLAAEALAGPEQRLVIGFFVRLVDRSHVMFPDPPFEKICIRSTPHSGCQSPPG